MVTMKTKAMKTKAMKAMKTKATKAMRAMKTMTAMKTSKPTRAMKAMPIMKPMKATKKANTTAPKAIESWVSSDTTNVPFIWAIARWDPSTRKLTHEVMHKDKNAKQAIF